MELVSYWKYIAIQKTQQYSGDSSGEMKAAKDTKAITTGDGIVQCR